MKKKKIIKIVACFAILLLISGCEMSSAKIPNQCIRCDIGGTATYFPTGVANLTQGIIRLAKYFAPVIIIIMGMIDMIKAIIASDEKQMKEAQNSLIRKIISGVAIFLVIAIVQFSFSNTVFKGDGDGGVWTCLANFISETNSETVCPGRNSLHGYDNTDADTGNETQGGNSTSLKDEQDMACYQRRNAPSGVSQADYCKKGYNCCPDHDRNGIFVCSPCDNMQVQDTNNSSTNKNNSDPGKCETIGLEECAKNSACQNYYGKCYKKCTYRGISNCTSGDYAKMCHIENGKCVDGKSSNSSSNNGTNPNYNSTNLTNNDRVTNCAKHTDSTSCTGDKTNNCYWDGYSGYCRPN